MNSGLSRTIASMRCPNCPTWLSPEVLNIMSIESVRAFFAEKAPDIAVIEFDEEFGHRRARGRGLWRRAGADREDIEFADRRTRGADRRKPAPSRMDNKKVKAQFGGKPKMLGLDEVAEITGHEVGGVCPFGLKTPLPVYCDISLRAFDIVVPAAGSTHSADRAIAHPTDIGEWVDVSLD